MLYFHRPSHIVLYKTNQFVLQSNERDFNIAIYLYMYCFIIIFMSDQSWLMDTQRVSYYYIVQYVVTCLGSFVVMHVYT